MIQEEKERPALNNHQTTIELIWTADTVNMTIKTRLRTLNIQPSLNMDKLPEHINFIISWQIIQCSSQATTMSEKYI